jgi:carbon-monoxide dehydrogenase large subunit
VVLGDTDRGDGFGSAGSRSLFTGGSAMRIGSERTIDHAKQLAAKELEAAGRRHRLHSRPLQRGKGTDVGIDLFALAASRTAGASTWTAPAPWRPDLAQRLPHQRGGARPRHRRVQIVAYSSVNDVGRVVNPMIVRGQLDGGAVQGIGQALQEHMVYDRDTGQPVTGSLMDYAAPRADGMACDFVTEMDQSTPCKNNPLGVKGVGELGTIGATPAWSMRWPMRWRVPARRRASSGPARP